MTSFFRVIRSKQKARLLATFFMFVYSINASGADGVGSKASFNNNWVFEKSESLGAQLVDFNDDGWEPVTLPHDWAISGPFDKKYNARNGGLPIFGTAWYRKHFTLGNEALNKQVSVTFDGAMDNSTVYVNGKKVGERPFGYIAFAYDISEFLNPVGEPNTIAVRLSPENYSARWYSGGGLYRNTWIEINDPVHIKEWGTFVTTPFVSQELTKVELETTLVNQGGSASKVNVIHQIKDAEGNVVAQSSGEHSLKAQSSNKSTSHFEIKNPILWDINNPYLYVIESQVWKDKTLVDEYTTPLGVRSIEFKVDDGFWLNGRRVQIKGVCLHHDNGPLGAVANRRAIQRKLEIMQEMGANAVRTSHNPPSPELVELANEMGILLQVESFDMWQIEKPTIVNGYNKYFDQWHEQDLRDMVVQNRNNPSIIMWSTGNEIIEQKEKDGWVITKHLTDIVKDEDPTRPVTAGLSMYPDALDNGLADELDIVGLNYKAYKYDEVTKRNKEWLILGTETSSVVSTRGIYHFPLEKYRKHDSEYVTSYDIVTPPWAYIPDLEFENLKNNPNVMGEFIWTGFDYLGEPTPYGGRDHGNRAYWNQDWPARSSSFGAVDLVGFPKDRFYLYQSEWTDKPMVHVLPHWNWENKIGDIIPIFAYTNAQEVELFINGKSKGRKVKGIDTVTIPVALKHDKKTKTFESKYRLRWDEEYQPGEIKVVAYNAGKVVASKTIKTAASPYSIELTPDRNEINADGVDLSYITVIVNDKNGNPVPNADNKIQFFVEGPAIIAGVGNGDSATVEPFKADYRRLFSGKAMLIIQSKAGEAGNIKIRAYSDQLREGTVVVKSL